MVKNKFVNHSDMPGFLQMAKKWNNLGVARSKVGGKKTSVDDKRKTFKAK